MAASNPGRTTVCITEAFGFLDDPDYDKEASMLKKSTSDTNLVFTNNSHLNEIEARIQKLNHSGQGTSNDSLNDDSISSLLRDKNDTYTIITYLGDKNNGVNRYVHDSGIGTEDLDVSDNYTIVTYLDENPSDTDSGLGSNQSRGSNIEIKGSNLETKGGKPDIRGDNHASFSIGDKFDVYSSQGIKNQNKNVVESGFRNRNEKALKTKVESNLKALNEDELDAVLKRHLVNSNSLENNFELNISVEQVEIDYNEHDDVDKLQVSDLSDDVEITKRGKTEGVDKENRDSEEVVLRRQSTNTDESRHRRTQQIVSDAFHFLKEPDYSDPDRVSSCSLVLSDDNDPDTDLCVSDLQVVQNSDQVNLSSPISDILVSHNKHTTDNPSVNQEDELTDGSFETPDSAADDVVSMRRGKFRRQSKDSASQEDYTDDSSDEDTGIYNESYRKSCWLKVDDDLSLGSVMESLDEDDQENGQSGDVHLTNNDQHNDKDEVFDDSSNMLQSYKGHNRSDSLATTVSESEFKKRYNFRRKCLVKRNDSQQEYHRMSAKIYDNEKSITIHKHLEDKDFGLHIIDSHPAIITDVDKGSAAHKAGIRQGQILISVNGVTVLESSHDEIVDLVQQNPAILRVEVANSNVHYVRDLQTPLQTGYMFKHTTALIRNWKKRYFILRHDNCLYYYKSEHDHDPLGAIPLLNYTVSRHMDNNREHCFKAEKYQAKTYYFATDTREQLTKWVGAMNEAAVLAKKRKDSWMDVTSHNVGLPALHIRKPECCGYLNKASRTSRNFRKRYCILKDACIYYYKNINSQSAQGMAHFHGYIVDMSGVAGKKFSFILKPPEPQMRTFYFNADNETDKIRWIDALNKSIQKWIMVD